MPTTVLRWRCRWRYQARWVRDSSRLKIAEKARQIGWSWTAAYRLVTRKSLCRSRLDAWISSRDELQARLFLEDCKHFATLLKIGADDLGQVLIDDTGHSAFVLQFANGLRLHSMSSSPNAQAGKRGDRVLDEFALHPDPRQLYAIAYPGATWGGSLEIFSTHRGTGSYFHELIQEIKYRGNPKGFSLHSVSLQQALEQGFLHKLQSKLPADDPRQDMDEAAYFDFVRRGCPDEESFLQEYCCQPADEQSAFLSYDLIQACEYPPTEPWQFHPSEPPITGTARGSPADMGSARGPRAGFGGPPNPPPSITHPPPNSELETRNSEFFPALTSAATRNHRHLGLRKNRGRLLHPL